MRNKRKYPLFVIGTSRNHGRGKEIDYISCASNELPFIAAVSLHKTKEYAGLYNPEDHTAVWSRPHGDIRMRIKVVSELPAGYSAAALTNLLRRALKEMAIRRSTQYVDINNVTDEDVIRWATIIRQQVRRTELTYTVRELADICGVSYRNVTKIENGHYNVSTYILDKIAGALGMETCLNVVK